MKKIDWYVIFAMFVLLMSVLYDKISTYFIMKNGVEELNPIMNFLIERIGLVESLSITGGITVIVLTILGTVVINSKKERTKHIALWVTTFATTIYVGVMYFINHQIILDMFYI